VEGIASVKAGLCGTVEIEKNKGMSRMKRNTLAFWIGLFIFGGLILQTFLQLELEKHGWDTRMEALVFIAISALFYFICVMLYQYNARSITYVLLLVIGGAATVLAIMAPMLFHAH
jgi:glucan phosphoethanolaminetransferase (alkaline phosphatase superfamily)